jgi:hypothetical protein
MVTRPEYGCTETTVAARPKSKPRYGSVVATRSPFEKLVATVRFYRPLVEFVARGAPRPREASKVNVSVATSVSGS